jgi:hypothetical protein
MSQQVNIERKLKFTNWANNTPNVDGNFNPNGKYVSYDFTELALDETNKYSKYADAGGAVALASGGITLTTDGSDADALSYAMGGIWWYPAKNPVVEMRFKLNVVTTVAINCGFTDAVTEATQTLPFLISGTTVADTATNGAMFCFDTNQTTDYWYIVNTNGGTQAGTILSSSYVPVANTDVTLRVKLDTAGNAYYFYNGIQVGYKALAVSSTTPLVGYFGIRNNSAAAHVATLKYCRYWCDF